MDEFDATASDPIALPGPRDVRGTLDRASPGERRDAADRNPSRGTVSSDLRSETVVVACPPHPQYGGSRSDPRLRAVSERLTDRGVDCLRFDYGSWAERRGERADARAALGWADERYVRIGLFGYSFGGAVAILVAAAQDEDDQFELDALCTLAPARTLADGASVPDAVPDVTAPAGLVYGNRDETVEWEPTVEAARQAGWRVTELAADHRFTGKRAEVASAVVDTVDTLLR